MTHRINSKKNKLLNFMSFLLILLPAALFTGPFIPDLITVILSVLFLVFCYKEKKFFFFNNLFFLFFFIFFFYLILRSFFSESPLFSLKSSLFYIRFGLLSLSILLLLNYFKSVYKYFYYSLFISIFFVSFDVIYQFVFGFNIFGLVNPDPSRISGIFGSEFIVGSYLVRLMPICLFLYFIVNKNNKSKHYFLISFLLIFTDLAIFLSGERASFFLLIFNILFMSIFSKKLLTFRLFSLLISIIMIIIICLNSKLIKERMFISTLSEIKIGNTNSTIQKNLVDEKILKENDNFFYIFNLKNHNGHFQTAYKMYHDNKLFGQGPNMFRFLCNKKEYKFNESSCSTHPHNTYLQVLAELGLVGLSFLILIIFFLFKELLLLILSNKKISNIFKIRKIILISSFSLTLWPIITTGNFFNNWLNIIYFLPIPFYIHQFIKYKL